LAVRRRAIFVWPNARVHEARRIGLEDAADDHTVGENVEVLLIPFFLRGQSPL
jgi:hypothetical protein